MEQIIGWLSVWALLGYFVAPRLPNAKTTKAARIQTFISGPLFWVGVSVLVAYKYFKN